MLQWKVNQKEKPKIIKKLRLWGGSGFCEEEQDWTRDSIADPPEMLKFHPKVRCIYTYRIICIGIS